MHCWLCSLRILSCNASGFTADGIFFLGSGGIVVVFRRTAQLDSLVLKKLVVGYDGMTK